MQAAHVSCCAVLTVGFFSEEADVFYPREPVCTKPEWRYRT